MNARIYTILRRLYYILLGVRYYIPHLKIIHEIQKKEQANVFFIISSLPMWRLQSLYDKLVKDSRFKVQIILLPFDTCSAEQQCSSVDELRSFFDDRSIPYIDATIEKIDHRRWEDMGAQLVFYQQMYATVYHGPLSIDSNLDKLICYLPYALLTVKGDWVYNTKFTNLAWRLYYPTDLHAEYARIHSFNHGKNVRIVGEPNADLLINGTEGSHEHGHARQGDTGFKYVIWAPHYSLTGGGQLSRSSFLWMADLMLRLSDEYNSKIQFILKPHPRLISTLYSLKEWGKEKTDAYFKTWCSGKNRSLYTGQYIGLFRMSDAMIHDCGSFTAEYLYTRNPVLFISNDFRQVYEGLDYFGSNCLDLHYHGSSEKDIVDFLEKVVLSGSDPMKDERQRFYDDFLTKNGCSPVGDTIWKSLTSDLFKS